VFDSWRAKTMEAILLWVFDHCLKWRISVEEIIDVEYYFCLTDIS